LVKLQKSYKRFKVQVHQKLVQLQGFEDEQATWEDTTALQQTFPELNLEDKVNLKGRHCNKARRGKRIIRWKRR